MKEKYKKHIGKELKVNIKLLKWYRKTYSWTSTVYNLVEDNNFSVKPVEVLYGDENKFEPLQPENELFFRCEWVIELVI